MTLRRRVARLEARASQEMQTSEGYKEHLMAMTDDELKAEVVRVCIGLGLPPEKVHADPYAVFAELDSETAVMEPQGIS